MSDASYIPATTLLRLTPSVNGLCTFPPVMNMVNWKNNIMLADFQVDCASQGAAIALALTNSNFDHNALYKGTGGGYGSPGTGNTFNVSLTAFPTANTVTKFVNATGGYGGATDYHLDPASSPYSAAHGCTTLCADDGTDLGADIDLVTMTTSGVMAGTPPWHVKAGLTVNPGSTKAAFRYNAPTSAACTVSVYSSIVRIAANLVGSPVADSAVTSVSGGTRRELLFSGLSASTPYTYSLSCGGGVKMVGNFTTRAAGSGSYLFWEGFASTVSLTHCTDVAMSAGCGSANSTTPIAVGTNAVVYWRQTSDTGLPYLLLAP